MCPRESKNTFPKADGKANQPLDTVSNDTTGPITPQYLEGNVFPQLVVDIESDHTQVFAMRKKRQAADGILKKIMRLEVATGKALKR